LVDMYQGRRISPDLPQQTYRDMRLNAPEEVAWLLDELASIPEFEDFWERAQLDIQEVPRVDDSVELTLLKDLNAVFHLTVPPGARRGTFYGITPGVYQLGFASGQIIWEETLTREDLCWEYGAPGTPMPLAAGGGEDSDQPTRQCAILDGQLNIKVYPGRTRGQLEVEVCKP
ncbi:MAG: hypothetical protein KJ052_11475, partial [Candidatus Hydrogenedentes bacterium]|nr:hypothetical protein [Candidatus Hydrogenedentota bacterium]